jgi:hypothetical protein
MPVNPVAKKRALRREIQEALDSDSVGELCAILARDGSNPLHRAVSLLHEEAVKALLPCSDVDQLFNGVTALDVCAELVKSDASRLDTLPMNPVAFPCIGMPGDVVPLPWCDGTSTSLAIASLLLEAKAAPSQALLAAAQCPDPGLGFMLLDAKADVNVQDGWARTPLWYAVQSCPEMVQRLLDEGANPRAGPVGSSPYDVCPADVRQVVAKAIRWHEVRLFVWAHARETVAPSTVGLSHLPVSVCHKVLLLLAS